MPSKFNPFTCYLIVITVWFIHIYSCTRVGQATRFLLVHYLDELLRCDSMVYIQEILRFFCCNFSLVCCLWVGLSEILSELWYLTYVVWEMQGLGKQFALEN